MDPKTNNQMNSMYQAPVGPQPEHKTSIVSIVILLIIAILVAVLGFGRINNLKEEAAKINNQNMMQQKSAQDRQRAEQAKKVEDASILNDLDNISADENAEDMTKIDASF
ncbi:MAG: hypothetical protein K9M11_02030 [Candidatus Pacebacteria bacterium]|nr:hypothetical protein [Candidatus Paceibacterota bacterium]